MFSYFDNIFESSHLKIQILGFSPKFGIVANLASSRGSCWMTPVSGSPLLCGSPNLSHREGRCHLHKAHRAGTWRLTHAAGWAQGDRRWLTAFLAMLFPARPTKRSSSLSLGSLFHLWPEDSQRRSRAGSREWDYRAPLSPSLSPPPT